MKYILFFLIITGLTNCNANKSENTQKKLQNESITSIDSLFNKFDNLNSPGFAIAILKDSTVLYKSGYGAANLDYSIPIDSNTAFDIASVSKQFTAACIALLIMDGKLNLNTPAKEYIPELSKYKDTIRIKHLMYNTSGLVDYFKLPRKHNISWLDFYYFDIDQAIATSLRQDSLAFKPGDQWDYSNVNFMLLTKIVEKTSGMPFTTFIEKRLFTPLNMKNTLVNTDITTIIKNRATPYNPRNSRFVNAYKKEGINVLEGGEWIQHNRNAPHYGGSGIISTINDLIKWEQNFFSQKLGGQEFYALMHKKMKSNHERNNQAFGLYFSTHKNREFVAWEGATYGISSQIMRFPEQKVAIIVLSNLGTGNARGIANKIADILIKASEL